MLAFGCQLSNGTCLAAHVLTPSSCGLDGRKNLCGLIDHTEHLIAVDGLHEPLGGHLVQCGNDVVVEAGCIEYNNGFAVQSELLPCEALEQFFHRANASGQSNHGIHHLYDGSFALVHRFGDDGLRATGVVPALFDHEPRNDTNHLAAGAQCTVSKVTHQPYSSVAIDELYTGFAY